MCMPNNYLTTLNTLIYPTSTLLLFTTILQSPKRTSLSTPYLACKHSWYLFKNIQNKTSSPPKPGKNSLPLHLCVCQNITYLLSILEYTRLRRFYFLQRYYKVPKGHRLQWPTQLANTLDTYLKTFKTKLAHPPNLKKISLPLNICVCQNIT